MIARYLLARKFEDISRDDIEVRGKAKLKDETVFFNKKRTATIGVTDDSILVYDKAGLHGYKEKIDIDDLDTSAIEISTERDLQKENKMTAAAYFAGHGAISTYKFKKCEIKLPQKNSDTTTLIIQVTKGNGKELMEALKERIPYSDEDRENGDSAMQQLKKKFVNNEISEEEFQRKKELLER